MIAKTQYNSRKKQDTHVYGYSSKYSMHVHVLSALALSKYE